jgi:transposase
LSFEWVRRPENRKPEEQKRIGAIRACSDELATALDLADEFAALLRKRSTGTLSAWLVKGEASSSPVRIVADPAEVTKSRDSRSVWNHAPQRAIVP